MHSCIYEGTVSHRRREPVIHEFHYRLFMVYLDLAELPSLAGRGGLISNRKLATRSFLRSDYLSNNSQSLDTEVRHVIQRQTGMSPAGPIRLLAQLRYFGIYFSPLNLFYVFSEADDRVECVLAEVSNTPWNERHCYVLWEGNRDGTGELNFTHAKEFHVSPFMEMDMEYRWRLTEPGSTLGVRLDNIQSSTRIFDAGMSLSRRELSQRQLFRMTLRYPLMTARISAAIYHQAYKLWRKKCPYYPHPKTQGSKTSLAGVSTHREQS